MTTREEMATRRERIIEALASKDRPMHYGEITAQLREGGYDISRDTVAETLRNMVWSPHRWPVRTTPQRGFYVHAENFAKPPRERQIATIVGSLSEPLPQRTQGHTLDMPPGYPVGVTVRSMLVLYSLRDGRLILEDSDGSVWAASRV